MQLLARQIRFHTTRKRHYISVSVNLFNNLLLLKYDFPLVNSPLFDLFIGGCFKVIIYL